MKILHLNYTFSDGSGIAVRRLHDALGKCDVQSELIYFRPYSKQTARIRLAGKKFNGICNILINRILKSEALNVIPGSLLRKINLSDADVVHLHWIHGEMISIRQVSKITKPLVWTFHDMWPMCGSEFYSTDAQYIDGYFEVNGQCITERFKSIVRRWVWNRKRKALQPLKLKIITPGNWMQECVQKSYLFRSHPCQTVFNCLDTEVFKPLSDRDAFRDKYRLPKDKTVLLFGASRHNDHRKGGDLLVRALEKLPNKDQLVLAVFGSGDGIGMFGIETMKLGFIEDESAMAELYNCADVVCVPSRIESFGQTASEPQACGVPVVAFNATGLKDVVEHKKTGYLAVPYDPEDFARGIQWVLDADQNCLARNARERAENLFGEPMVTQQMITVYEKEISRGSLQKM